MSDEDEFRAKAEALLRLAAQADNMKRRSELIDEAMRWHSLALDAHDRDMRTHDRDAADDWEARV